MYLEKASAKIYNYEIYILELKLYKKSLEDFLYQTQLKKKDGKKLMQEIKRIEYEIERKRNVVAEGLRLEFKQMK